MGRQQLLLANLIEVRSVARRIQVRIPPQVPFDDLFQAGILGLIDAVDRFDPKKNSQFRLYARFRIRGAILDSLRGMDWSPRRLRERARRLEQVSHALAGQLGRSPSISEIAFKLGLSSEALQRLRGELRGLAMKSLNTGSEEEVGLRATLEPESDPFQMTFRREILRHLDQAIAELNEREREVVGLYYLEELTMSKVGKILGIGESRVSQIHTSALIRLRSSSTLLQSRGRVQRQIPGFGHGLD